MTSKKLSGYLTPYPCEPIAPQSDRFDTEEEYAEAVKAYEGRVEAHRERVPTSLQKPRQEKSPSTSQIGRNDVTLGYMAANCQTERERQQIRKPK